MAVLERQLEDPQLHGIKPARLSENEIARRGVAFGRDNDRLTAQRTAGMAVIKNGHTAACMGGHVQNIDAGIIGRKIDTAGISFAGAAAGQRLTEKPAAKQLTAGQLNFMNPTVVVSQISAVLDKDGPAQHGMA